MRANSISGRLKSFDMYKKLPRDLTEPTFSGAIVSIASLIIMAILFISELNAYIEIDETSEMFIDVGHASDKIRVNLDIELPRFPCDILSLDMQDIMGSHYLNLEGDLKKIRIDRNQQILNSEDALKSEGGHHDNHGHGHQSLNLDRLARAFNDKEGCLIQGFIYVNKVPGNFHISLHAYQGYLPDIYSKTGINTFDLSHTLKHLSFGDDSEIKNIKKQFSKGVLNPLDGTSKIKPEDQKNLGIMYNYYISVVPTFYETISSEKYFVYQFTSNSNIHQGAHFPAIFFTYDISPVTVRFSQYRESFFHFLVQICAIIGGVFTVAGIIDSIIHRSVLALLKKAEINKLG